MRYASETIRPEGSEYEQEEVTYPEEITNMLADHYE